jgi:hypothetical protein
MANRGNHTGKLYIRSKTGYRKPPKRLVCEPPGWRELPIVLVRRYS